MVELQHYMDKEGRPVVRRSYCVFADLLGLTQGIRACRDQASESELCSQVFGLFAEAANRLGDPWNSRENKFAYQFISDGLVIGTPVTDRRDDAELGFALLDIAEIQLGLVLRRFPLRGGFTVGNLHLSQRLVFGRSFLEAYDLERNHAKFPRIVVNSVVADLADRHANYYSERDIAPQTSLLWKDEDGEIFINYLDGANGDDGTDWDVITAHRDIVSTAIRRYDSDPHILEKYEWMADYHNEFSQHHWNAFAEEAAPTEQFLRSLLVEVPRRTQRRFMRWGID